DSLMTQFQNDDELMRELNNPQHNIIPAEEVRQGNDSSGDPALLSNRMPDLNDPIIEALIDGGQRKYVQRQKPVLPSWLKYEGTYKIRVECTVDRQGRVENVKVLSPSGNEVLDKLAVDTFKQFRYKPATFRGEPVRFRVVEIMIFR
ncbi:MAG: energy transducer TonB, partial [Calditrichia bacterium]